MRNGQIKVLLIEDDPGYARLIMAMLKDSRYTAFKVENVQNLKKGLSRLKREGIDVVLLDLTLPDSEVLETFQSVYELKADIPIVVLSSFTNEDAALNAVKMGAQDYLYKNEVNPGILFRSLSYAVERKSAEEKLRKAHDELEKRVEERTAQLRKANKKLALEIKENEIIEDALRSSKEKYRLLVETSKDGIAVIQDAKLIFHNNIFEELLGYSEEELTDKPFINFLHPDDSEMMMDRNIRRLKGEDVEKNYEFRGLTKAGETIYIDMTVAMTEWEGRQASLCFLRDITEQKRAYEALLSLRKAVESSNIGITITDLDRKIVYTNPSEANMHGWKVEELIGKNADVFGPEEFMQPMSKTEIKKMKGFTRETINIRKDKSTFHVKLTSDIVKDETGESLNIISVCEDITEQKRAEEALRKSEEQYRLVVENTNDTIIIAQDGKVKYINESGPPKIGYSKEDILNLPIGEFVHPDDRQDVMERYLRRLKGEEIQDSTIFRIIGSDNKIRWAEGYSVLITLEDKPATLTFLSDITERKHAEEALMKSEEKYRLLVENAIEGIIVSQEGLVKYVNPTVVKITGYSKEDFINSTFFEDLIHSDDRDEIVKRYYDRLEEGETTQSLTYRIVDKNGDIKWVESNRISIVWEGEPATLSFVQEITKRKRAEELLLRYHEELEQEVEERTAELKEINKKLTTEVRKHKQTEQALEESENMARTLLNTPIDAIIMIDPEGNIIDLNDTIAERFKMKPSELKKLNIWELFPQEIVSKRKTFVDKVIDTRKPIRFDDEIDGIWNDNIINPILDENGNVSKIAVLSHDITNLKQIEEELRESELRYRTLFENSIEAVFTVDIKGNFTSANNAMAEILGYSSDEIIGTNYRKFSTPEVSKMVFNAYSNLYRTGKPIKDLNYNIIRKNSEERTIDGYVNLVYEGSEIIGFQGTMRDVTDKIRSEQQLESRLNIQTALADISRTIISDENPDINNILKILGEAIDVNRAYLFMVGENGTKIDNTHEWCDDKSEPQIQYLQDLDLSLFSWSSKVILTGESLNIPDVDALPEDASGEKEILKAQNIKSCLFVPVKSTDSEVIGFMGFDDTEKTREWLSEDLQALRIVAEMLEIFWARRRAEEERKRYAEELEKTNEEVKVFSYIVSHDLRNPLVNIKGLANILKESYEQINSKKDLLLQQLADEDKKEIETAISEDIPKALEFVDSTVKRMDNLINAIIKLSRFGRKELQFEEVDMNETVQITLESLAHYIDKQGVVIKVDKLPPVFADLTSMLQIMGNIIANAINYLDSDRKGKIEICGVSGSNETTFYVKDNGRGIEEKNIEKIFQVFQRVGDNDVSGEGMGLSYVKTLVERHGGKIWCESKFGKGTTFTFTIRKNLIQRL